MTDGTGSTGYGYDAFGRLSTVSAPAGTTGYSYDSLGRIASLTYPDGHVLTRGYDAADRNTYVTDWTGKKTTFGYNPDGNQTTTSYPNGVIDTSTVNAADQTTGVTITHGSTTLGSFGYTPDPIGQVGASTDSLTPALSTAYTYTPLNQLGAVASATAHYTYDAAGNATTLSNGATQTYDAAGQLKASTPPTGQPSAFTFDGVGDRTGAFAAGTAPTCGVCVLATSGVGTLTVSGTAAVSSNGPVGVDSTAAGAITASGSATVSGSKVTVAGTAKTSGTAKITPAAAAGSVADPLAGTTIPTISGTATKLTVSGSTVQTAQPGVYSSISVTGNASVTLAAGRYVIAGGGLTVSGSAVLKGSGVTIYLSCTTYPTPCSSGTGGAGVQVSGAATLNLTGAADPSGIALFSDPHNTVAITFSGSPTTTIGGHLYAASSQLSVTGNAILRVTGIVDAAQVAATGSSTLTDTIAGTQPTAASYSYDQARRLTQAVNPAGTFSYTYNGDGMRATSTSAGATASYAWDVQTGTPALLADTTNDYVYGPSGNVIEQVNKTTGAANYLHADQIGSVRVITDASGNVASTASWDPYGNTIAHTGTSTTPFGFTGQYTDPTGLIYLRARYYDPATAQFLTVDPALPTTHQPYVYAADNPLNLTDPTGLTPGPCTAADKADGQCITVPATLPCTADDIASGACINGQDWWSLEQQQRAETACEAALREYADQQFYAALAELRASQRAVVDATIAENLAANKADKAALNDSFGGYVYNALEAGAGCVAGIGTAEGVTGGGGAWVPGVGVLSSATIATLGCGFGAAVSLTGGQLPDNAPTSGDAYTPRHASP